MSDEVEVLVYDEEGIDPRIVKALLALADELRPMLYEMLEELRPEGREAHIQYSLDTIAGVAKLAAETVALTVYMTNAVAARDALVPLLACKFEDGVNDALDIMIGRAGKTEH